MYVLLFLILISQGIHCLQCHQDERSTLLQLKSSFTISTSTDFYDYDDQYYKSTWPPETDSWDENTNCCTAWSGVTCDNASWHVIKLDLSCSSRILGTLSSNNSLVFLNHLQRLDLSRNDFRGSPTSSKFGQFKNMTHLFLFESNFSGLVPLEISNLSNLISFELSSYEFRATAEMKAATFKAIVQNRKSPKQLLLASVYMSNVPPSLMMNFSSSSLESLDLSFCFCKKIITCKYVQYIRLQPFITKYFTNNVSKIIML
ncbi:LRR domain containing protein [Parasponia andersonii]|uniref:LRR domain containing protein n=1 Tax=Parasponia andersonii TaxID=3476 RepID=A0A2P5DED1_PARAD|nr:LRR domain containing protein [Parasponia andersonii]